MSNRLRNFDRVCHTCHSMSVSLSTVCHTSGDSIVIFYIENINSCFINEKQFNLFAKEEKNYYILVKKVLTTKINK